MISRTDMILAAITAMLAQHRSILDGPVPIRAVKLDIKITEDRRIRTVLVSSEIEATVTNGRASSPMHPTAGSLAHLKTLGYHVRVVEKWNSFAKIRHDLLAVDLLALKAGEPVLVIQATREDLRRRSSSSTP
ncbi:MAG TPA: hypothetical protein VLD60_07675 [Nitrospira sp.]|nr:hypothetical protein [Nitrospira sp.]